MVGVARIRLAARGEHRVGACCGAAGTGARPARGAIGRPVHSGRPALSHSMAPAHAVPDQRGAVRYGGDAVLGGVGTAAQYPGRCSLRLVRTDGVDVADLSDHLSGIHAVALARLDHPQPFQHCGHGGLCAISLLFHPALRGATAAPSGASAVGSGSSGRGHGGAGTRRYRGALVWQGVAGSHVGFHCQLPAVPVARMAPPDRGAQDPAHAACAVLAGGDGAHDDHTHSWSGPLECGAQLGCIQRVAGDLAGDAAAGCAAYATGAQRGALQPRTDEGRCRSPCRAGAGPGARARAGPGAHQTARAHAACTRSARWSGRQPDTQHGAGGTGAPTPAQ